MDTEDIRSYCLKLPGVTEDIKWKHNLCFSVAGKLFLLVSLDEAPPSAAFKVPQDDFDSLCCRDGFSQAPYFAKNMWVRIEDIGLLSSQEWETFIRESYELVKMKLPARTRKELDSW
jgi:predicted DNA-binding protein (MmcQ/YjbR family)